MVGRVLKGEHNRRLLLDIDRVSVLDNCDLEDHFARFLLKVAGRCSFEY